MRLEVEEIHRAWLPLKIYPISAGVKGGLAGGVAMAIFAVIYGLLITASGIPSICWPQPCIANP